MFVKTTYSTLLLPYSKIFLFQITLKRLANDCCINLPLVFIINYIEYYMDNKDIILHSRPILNFGTTSVYWERTALFSYLLYLY